MGTSLSARNFEVEARAGVVVICLQGSLDYEETNRAISRAVEAAAKASTTRMLFDLRRADLANYYSYTVRHAEVAPRLGLHTGFTLAFLGAPAAHDVIAFMEMVARNRGWRARAFTRLGEAMKWLADA